MSHDCAAPPPQPLSLSVVYGNGVENLKKGEPTSMMKVDMGASLSYCRPR